MKHGKKGRKFGRTRDQRKALLKGLAVNLILKEKITTTEAKAKEVRPFIEKLITKSKTVEPGSELAKARYLARYLPDKARKKMIKEIGPRFQGRAGGYTRITKLGLRQADAAKMAIIELVK
ncbi:MAG: 50S ribosomal protein L17 [Parcubacteria group bacterium]|jgi:large subunit ribosomal protein L17|nr:50S ribosomal protein L17 [Parcubacteria group bacterium]|tara:strand:+ start:2208 stop:2570 length:363 start_codon:yes stop_codon:yes gene_type:complete